MHVSVDQGTQALERTGIDVFKNNSGHVAFKAESLNSEWAPLCLLGWSLTPMPSTQSDDQCCLSDKHLLELATSWTPDD